MIKIYGSPMSSAGRCLWMLEEVGAAYECIEPNLRDPEQRALYTSEVFAGGKVPYLVDEDVKLFESMAINNYLAAKYKPELLGSDLVARALIDQWSFWAISNLQPEAIKVLLHSSILPETQRVAGEVEAGRSGCARFLAQLEASLTHDYLLGDQFTAADLNCGSVVNLASRVGIQTGPRVTAWLERLRARPAYKKALAH
ncbi:MAG: glutathione S-transferase family protein [Deltaproteobacteria bacterium]|nr:glutathione S-transferase family protein [Deltaproteobacteria bacterium]